VGDIIGLEYSIYEGNILDEIRGASPMMVKYFADNKDTLKLRLHIYVNEPNRHTTFFTYYIGGVKICTNTDVLSINQIKRIQADLKHKKLVKTSIKNNQIKNSSPPPTTPIEKNNTL